MPLSFADRPKKNFLVHPDAKESAIRIAWMHLLYHVKRTDKKLQGPCKFCRHLS